MSVVYITPTVTSFLDNGDLDFQGCKNVYDHLIEGGVDGLLVMGSTGEFSAMSMAQKKSLIDMTVSHVKGATRVFFGTACDSVEETIELSNYALKSGGNGVMVIGPYYYGIDDAAIENFYDDVASRVEGPVYIYNFPARSGFDVNPQIICNLLRKHKNIAGVKDSVSDMGHARQILTATMDDFPGFQVYSGFDENLLHNAVCGGAGCIGALSNVYPEVCSQWRAAINAKDWDRAAALQKKINVLMGFYAINPFFIGIIKKAMIMRGVKLQPSCRKPFLLPSDAEVAKIRAVMEKAEKMI